MPALQTQNVIDNAPESAGAGFVREWQRHDANVGIVWSAEELTERIHHAEKVFLAPTAENYLLQDEFRSLMTQVAAHNNRVPEKKTFRLTIQTILKKWLRK